MLVTLVTYAFVLLTLVLGLFLPIYNGNEILALKIGDAFSALGAQNPFSLEYPMASFFNSGITANLMAIVAVMYLFATAIAVICLIPVILLRKNEKARNAIAYSAEAIALCVLSVFMFAALTVASHGTFFGSPELLVATDYDFADALSVFVYNPAFSYNYLIPLIGIVIVLFIQTVTNKGFTGVAKISLFLLSFVAAFCLYDLSALFGTDLSSLGLPAGVFGSGSASWQGIQSVTLFTDGGLRVYIDLLCPDTTSKALVVLTLFLGLFILANYFIDLIGLTTDAKRAGHIFNVIRYALILVFVLCMFIAVPVGNATIGLLLLLITLVTLVQLLISVVRLVMERRRVKHSKMHRETSPEERPREEVMYTTMPAGYQTVDPQIIPIYVQQPYVQPIIQQPVVQQPEQGEVIDAEPYVVEVERRDDTPPVNYVVERPMQEYKNPYEPPAATPKPTDPQVYTVNVYRGPIDEFMKKLSNEEKIEFSQVFIEKTRGDLGNIPDYVVGGNNEKFFPAVFIYLGRVRELVSDELLNKMYRELNMM